MGGAIGLNDIPRYTNWTWLYFSVIATIFIISNFVNPTMAGPVYPSGKMKLQQRPWELIQHIIRYLLL